MGIIILSWMRWTWKSTIWKILSEKIGLDFLDLDKLIEKNVWNINNYIDLEWWKKFRDLEHNILKEVLAIKGNKIIWLWGGTIIFKRNLFEINNSKNKKIYFLETDLENIESRIKKEEKNNNKRSSLTWKGVLEELREVYSEREEIYKKNCDYIINNNLDTEETIANILRKIK